MRQSLRSLAGATWPFLPDESLTLLWSTCQSLETTQFLAPAELERLQLVQMRQVLAHAVAYVPHHRAKLGEAGIVPAAVQTMHDLRRLPLLTRAELLAEPEAFRAQTVPRGMVAAGVNVTSETGLPIPQTNLTQLWWFAGALRDLAWSGADPGGTLATLRVGHPSEAPMAVLPSSPNWLPPLAGLLRTGPAHAMRIDANLRDRWAWLLRIQPNFLVAPPQALRALACLAHEEGMSLPSLQAVQSESAPLSEITRRLVSAVFGVPVVDRACCAEIGPLAFTCPSGAGLHLHAENAIVEVLDENDQPCGPGETGRVVVTSLRNFLCPLVRYELGDEATLAPQPCSCSRGLPLLAALHGPRWPRLVRSDGSSVAAREASALVEAFDAVWQHQFIQASPESITLRLVVGRSWSAALGEDLHEKLLALLGSSMRLKMEVVPRLALTRSGKQPTLLSAIPAPLARDVHLSSAAPLARSVIFAAPNPAVPVRSLPGNAWPPLPTPDMAAIWTAYQELDRTQWLPHDEVERLQLAQARTLLTHCREQVPFYRRIFDEMNFDPSEVRSLADFRRLPLLERRLVKENAEALEAKLLPAGMIASGDAKTSGSSGVPLRVLQTDRVEMWWLTLFLRDLVWCGFDMTASLAIIRSTARTGEDLQRLMAGVSLPQWLVSLCTLLETGPCHVLDLSVDVPSQLDWLFRVDADYLLSYPANLECLARLLLQDGRKLPRLRAIQSIGETLSPEARRVIESGFGVPVHNLYSCAEAGYLASPCPSGEGLHVHAENVLLEVLDESGEPCQPGETGRVAVTTLQNFRMPLVRYLIGDEVTLGPLRCKCGRGLPLLKEVHGKTRPMMHLPNGKRKRSNKLAVFFQGLGGHLQHQVIQKAADHVVVRLVPGCDWSDEHLQKLHAAFADFYETAIRVEVELMTALPLPSSGKFQSMVCELESSQEGN